MGKLDLSALKDQYQNGTIDMITVAGVDMQGKLFGKKVPVRYFLDDAVHGIHTCAINFIWDVSLKYAENYTFCNFDTGLHDIKVIPDISTLRTYPWIPKNAVVIGDIYNKDGSEVTIAPRNILKKQLAKAGALGYRAYAASEIEFHIFKETIDSAREKNFSNLQPLFSYPVDYSIYRLNVDDWFLGQLARYLEEAGIPVEALKGEWGNGQVELNVQYAEALEMADRTAIYKNGIKEIAALNNLMVTFMAKHDTEASGSSGHTHISLWDLQGNNVFYDANHPYKLSDTGRYFLGGMMALAPEFMLFYAPYINSYKRLANTGGAPNTQTWGEDNRTTAFRVDGQGKSCRIENRIPGSDANHYLVLAACLASGLYGIEHKIDIEAPTKGDASSAPGVKRLPANLAEAIQKLSNSKIARELLGADVVDHYLTAAQNELNDYFLEVTDWERKKYFEFI
ncbi:glutamine synthetase family protein [Brevibacillus centrosporus]|uniref:glutamine synthetase family protein n=1 Tax=Brevibacillus centrosporus TaxID=54910 RepID=UPI002E1B7AB7|nr:glutamine synthetase family protein [Brevibacillus centrosporus]